MRSTAKALSGLLSLADMSRQDMEKAAIDHLCGVCGSGLSVAWGGAFGHQCYVLRLCCAAPGTYRTTPLPATIKTKRR